MPVDPIIGQIMPVAFAQPQAIPRGWFLCDGSLVSIVQYQALFALLGTRYGGNGQTTFGLPDLRGRAILGGQGDGVGPRTGTPTVTLTRDQLPAHNHFMDCSTATGGGRSPQPANNLFGKDPSGVLIYALAGSSEVPTATDTNVTPTGGGGPHDNMQPYLAINYLIAYSGIFPSRN